MNNPHLTLPQESEIEGVQTPFCLAPQIDPRKYLPSLGQWPCLPSFGLKAVMTPALKKQVGRLLGDLGEATATRDANDAAGAHTAMQKAIEAKEFSEAERIRRTVGEMALPAHDLAVGRIREIADEAKVLTLAFLPVAAEEKLRVFTAEVIDAEARLVRHGRPVVASAKMEEGYFISRFHLWNDDIVASAFSEYWFLAHLWPAEFQTPKYENRDGLSWLAEILGSEA